MNFAALLDYGPRLSSPPETPPVKVEKPTSKTCVQCGETKPVALFSIASKNNKPYFRNKCKACAVVNERLRRTKKHV